MKINLIGESKLGPYLTFTLVFFKDKKISSALAIDKTNKEFARGLASFSSNEIEKILGHHSKEIEKILGYTSKSEVVHKDDMVEI